MIKKSLLPAMFAVAAALMLTVPGCMNQPSNSGGGGGGTTYISNYTVEYNGNGSTGGSVPEDTNSYTDSQTVTVLGNTGSLVNPGFSFLCWNTQANDLGSTYYPGQTFVMGTSSIILYAQWTSLYTVTYYGNGNSGGTTPVDPGTYTNGQNVTVMGNTGNLIRTGFTFIEWNTAPDGTGTMYTNGAAFRIGTGSVSLFAIWAATYVVQYSGNGNSRRQCPCRSEQLPAGC